MQIFLYVAGAALLLVGLAGLVLPVLPGPLVMLGGVVVIAWAGDFARLGWPSLTIAALLSVAMLAVDQVASLLGARAFGASRWAMVGGAVGLLVGLFFGLPGIILGPAAGAVAFELWKGRNLRKAGQAGVGVLVGFVVGSVAKIVLAFVLIGVVAFALIA